MNQPKKLESIAALYKSRGWVMYSGAPEWFASKKVDGLCITIWESMEMTIGYESAPKEKRIFLMPVSELLDAFDAAERLFAAYEPIEVTP